MPYNEQLEVMALFQRPFDTTDYLILKAVDSEFAS
jgi:hypothetical protein